MLPNEKVKKKKEEQTDKGKYVIIFHYPSFQTSKFSTYFLINLSWSCNFNRIDIQRILSILLIPPGKLFLSSTTFSSHLMTPVFMIP